MTKYVVILSFPLLVAPLASAEISKCVAKDGTDLYQNFPCDIDSIGSMPTKAPSEKAGLPQTVSKQAKPNAPLQAIAAAGRPPTPPTEPRVGMTIEEVRVAWGDPVETDQDEPIDGRIEIWRYADGRTVQFNHKHRVLAVQR